MKLRHLLCLISLSFGFASRSGLMLAQEPTSPIPASGSPVAMAEIHGTIQDPSRSAISRAKVSAISVANSAALQDSQAQLVQSPVTATSDSHGEFRLALPPGQYRITIRAEGFADAARTVDSGPGVSILPVVQLQVEEQRSAVTVTEPGAYQVPVIVSATRTQTALLDIPQSISVVNGELIRDQAMTSMADVVRYIPGITMTQGEGHRDAPVIRGNSSTADFFVNGVRDDVQYFRDLYNLDRVEALKGPNAMIFGRGGGGGVINRVTKEAIFMPLREVTLQGGSFGNRRASADLNQTLRDRFAFRLNGMYENSNSFRDYFNLQRYGIAPTVTVAINSRTRARLSYEYFNDARVVDRGIPSYLGRPSDAGRSTFFGNPDLNRSAAAVHLGSAVIEHQRGKLNIRNSAMFGAYDKFYQNILPGAVSVNQSTNQTLVSLSGYNNATQRNNAFNQTDVTYVASTGRIRHMLLAGAEVGRQATDNFRGTAYFNNAALSINVPFANPTDVTPVTFRQSATDADNRPIANVAAAYVQDQVYLSRFVQLTAGLRFDHFNLKFANNRTGDTRRRIDNMISPRAGLVIKPIDPLSLYVNYSVSYLPSAGDQFSSLDATSQTLKPEKFTNYEAGAKWDIRRSLSLTAAVYRLDRANTRAADPSNPARLIQTGSQRTNGVELGVNGTLKRAWTIAGGYAHQDAFISSTTSSAAAGMVVAQVPRHTFSLWNNYRITAKLGAGLGLIHQADMFAAIDNTVRLPGFTRADAAIFYSLTEKIRLQANVENLTDRHYFVNANSNNNISPGNARAARVGLTFRF
jgi:catecholate siderophore receptor